MIFIKKDRLALSVLFIFLSVIALSMYEKNNHNNTVETITLPVTNKVIVIDAGHGIPDEGAESQNGVSEAKINLNIALKLQKLLEQSGATVILTRSDDNGIYDIDSKTLKEKKVSDLKNRVKIGNEVSADAFISIHLNKIPQQKYYGWQTFYKSSDENSIKLANSIQNNLNKAIKKNNDRIPMKLDSIYIVKNVEIPITIVECGFLSNPDEEKELLNDEYQNRLAWGIYSGIMDYFI
ncbi:MAG: N-acetylmuramoyl-L-alanine amidase CwlD [Clostridia bacterium]|nr:N-acetylmuramoyl-L-alanine amidase CwlD [Clostridia bacterium]